MSNLNIKAKVKIESSSFKSFMKELGVKSSNMAPPFKEYGKFIDKETKQQFLDEKDPSGNAWEPLAPATLRKKKTNYKLRETFKMSQSFYAVADKESLQYGLKDPKYKFHHFGTRRMPARVVIGDTNERRKTLNKLIVNYLKLKRAGRK